MLAQQRLTALARWLDKSSASYPSPCSNKPPQRNMFGGRIASTHPVETVVVGRYAEILPWDFDTLPTSDFDPQALPLFVSQSQAEALNLPPVADLSPPSGQGRAFERLAHMIAKMEDARLDLDPTWRSPDGWRDRPCALVGIPSPDMTLAAAVDAAGASGVDLDAFPLLVVPTWHLSAKERVAIGHRLPFLP